MSPMNPRLLRPRLTGDPDALRYIAAVQAADGQTLEPAVAKAISDFVVGCKLDGIWSAMKASCILSGARTLSGALTPLTGTAPSNASFVSGDYDRKTGLARLTGTKYINTNRASNADGQDNFHASAYCSVFNVGQTIFGATDGSTVIDSRLRYELGALQTSARKQFSAGLSSDTAPFSGGAATFLGVRRSAGTGFRARFRGTNYDYNSAASAAPSALNTFIFALNNNGTAADNANQSRLMFYSVGESLDLALLDSRVTALATAIGAAL